MIQRDKRRDGIPIHNPRWKAYYGEECPLVAQATISFERLLRRSAVGDADFLSMGSLVLRLSRVTSGGVWKRWNVHTVIIKEK